MFEGRAFTLTQLKRSLISICGGYAVGIYTDWEYREVWKLLEAIEMVVDLQEKDK